jgi:hypothetical protein
MSIPAECVIVIHRIHMSIDRMLSGSIGLVLLAILHLCGASVEAEAIEADSIRAERPSFSMTPT